METNYTNLILRTRNLITIGKKERRIEKRTKIKIDWRWQLDWNKITIECKRRNPPRTIDRMQDEGKNQTYN